MREKIQVFLSYSAKDRKFVEILAQTLEQNGCSTFYDAKVRIGEDWRDVLGRARQEARFIVSVMSTDYFASFQAEQEWRFALDREKEEQRVVLLPVMYRLCDVPLSLQDKAWADFRKGDEFDLAIGRLLMTIRGFLREERYQEEGRNHQIQSPTAVEFPGRLLQAIKSGDVVLYVGAGLSAPAGLPTWQQFAERLVAAASEGGFVPERDRQFFENALRDLKTDYVVDEIVERAPGDFIEKFLLKTFLGKPAVEAHDILRDLPFSAALTTNFDNLLEETFRKKFRNLPVYTPRDTDALLGAFSRQSFFILKLYGSLDRPDSVLVSPAQFDEAISENIPFQSFMESLFVSRTILFVGCSLEGIEAYLRGLRFRTLSNSRHYALSGVLGTSWEAISAVLERRYGIQVIPYRKDDAQDQLQALRQLRNHMGGTQSSLAQTASLPLKNAAPIKKLVLTNIGPFQHQEIDLDSQTNILLGNNGVGKSTILRALAVALCGKDAEQYAARLIRTGVTSASIQLETERQTYQTILQATTSGVELTSLPVRPLDSEGWLALGFPALRTASGARTAREASRFPTVRDILPLARGDSDLRLDDLQTWIADLDYRAKHEQSLKTGDRRYERLIQTFFDTVTYLLEGVKIEFQGVDPATKQITVATADGVVPFEYVSQGTSSLISWVGVLLQRLYEIFGDDEKPTERYVLVLMDEIDAHMHPLWQLVLLPRIRERFPHMQLVATTHSPLILNGLKDKNLLHVVRSQGNRQVEVLRYEMDLKGLETDRILTSPLFGLADSRDLVTQKEEKRYDFLRSLGAPSPEQIAERESLARQLFGSRASELTSISREVYKALEASIAQNLGQSSTVEEAQKLSDAEKLIEKIIAGR